MLVDGPRIIRRRGAAVIETAVVVLPLFMFIFGIFEFGRLLMDWNLVNNAAREGCRHALVNNTVSTISTDVDNVVRTRMGRSISSFNNLSISVSGTHVGVSTPVNNLLPGDFITVSVSGRYKFMDIVPLVPMPSLTINSSVTMLCEGGN